MKAFLAFTLALFALTAVQAFTPNMTAFNLGLIDQLGLDSTGTVKKDAILCAKAMQELAGDANNAFESLNYDPEPALRALLKLVVDFKSRTVQEECNDFLNDLLGYLELTPDYDYLNVQNQILPENFAKYFPNIIQQVFSGLGQFAHEDQSYTAGQTIGYVAQILLGFEVPPTIEVNVTYVPTDRQEWAAFGQGFLAFFNITDDKEIDAFGECVSSVYDAVSALIQFPGEYSNGGLTPLEKIRLVRKTMNTVLDGFETCEAGSHDVLEQIYAELINNFEGYPVPTLAYLGMNVITNLPEINATLTQAAFEVDFGNYAEGGYLVGQTSKIITDVPQDDSYDYSYDDSNDFSYEGYNDFSYDGSNDFTYDDSN